MTAAEAMTEALADGMGTRGDLSADADRDMLAAAVLAALPEGWQLVNVARLAQAITESGEPARPGIWAEAEALMAALESQR